MKCTLDPRKTFRSTASGTPAQRPTPLRPKPAPSTTLGGPLTNQQKAALVLLAKEAWHTQGRPADFDTFRHRECQAACGKPGLTAALQSDYNALKAHFLTLKGEPGRALNAHLADATEPTRVARYKLDEALRNARLPEAYAAAIAKRQHRLTLDQLSPKQLWQLVYTINNRATARRQKSA